VPEFYGLRFALGVAEAGLYPTLLYYLTLWFPQAQQARVSGFLLLGSAFGNGGGALISGALLEMNGTFGLAGWQWIFLVTGALPLVTTVLVLRFLPDRPEHARFLSAPERARLIALVAADKPRTSDERHVLAALADPRVLGFSLVYALLGIALFGMIYWTPTAIRGFGVSGAVNGALTGAPWAITALLLVTVPARLKTRKAVLTSLTATGLIGALAFAIAALYRAPELRYTALVVGTPCISLSIAVFWALPVRLFAGVRAAAAIAAINVFGNVGGFIAQNLMPAAARAGGGPGAAMWVPSLCLLAIGIGALVVRGRRAPYSAASLGR
ncbi:MAG: MFS transporter, partial [Alphaproteobacteria bacterium]|nr:MFS transporter [Alphaproteobacteria bacterium]